MDYKVLFMGACTLILVLGGGLIGIYYRTSDNRFLDLKQAIDGEVGELRRSNSAQWDILHDTRSAISRNTQRIDHLADATNDQETRIRVLEGESKRSRR